MNDALRNLKIVFGNWRYSLFAIIIAFLFYELNALITNHRAVISSIAGYQEGTFSFLVALGTGYHHTVMTHTFVLLVITSVLIGVLFALIAYKSLAFNKKPGFLAGIGAFFGILAPGCAACGVGVFSALGIGAAVLHFLPFHGAELSAIAIIILGYATITLANDLMVCKRK